MGTALSAVPHPVAALGAESVPTGWFDPCHLGPVISQQHRRHRAGAAPRQIEYPKVSEHSSHRMLPFPTASGDYHSSHYLMGAADVLRGWLSSPGAMSIAGPMAPRSPYIVIAIYPAPLYILYRLARCQRRHSIGGYSVINQ